MEKQSDRSPPFRRSRGAGRRRRTARVTIVGIVLAGLAGPLSAQEEETWLILLRDQLLVEKQCQLNYTTGLRKFEIAGQQALDVRAHCYDQRAFDSSWRPEEQRYEFRFCEPTAC